ncbi:desmoglein-2-like protein [Hoplias malabaricus]|uniref:desmoglein-2-like protein n=1 Tax=Hoplias malabaricus TaxID=27720 RepID=UPI003463114E
MATLLVFISVVVLTTTIIQVESNGGQQILKRQKREWIIPPDKLLENKDYTRDKSVAKIRSDEETRTSIRYSLKGHGADKDPVNLFIVDTETGLVRITGLLDREKIPNYTLWGEAKFLNGSYAEKDILLRIQVVDVNDCDPVFNMQPIGEIYELSHTDTYVINITATDEDDPNTEHAMIAYSIEQQKPTGDMMFKIDQSSGRIFVRRNTLDRELQDRYTLIIKGSDMNGKPGGRTASGTVIINILDVNDNVPTLKKTTYEGSVEENVMNVEVLRIQCTDLDQINTDNWRAVYSIISGNEAGYFIITTDNKTNEGVLTITKQVDYEELKEINLQVTVSNKAAYHSSVIIREPQTYPIKIKITNQPEGPRFQPTVKVISLSEDSTTINMKKVIATYTAIDSDTLKTVTNVRYAKGGDIDNWLIIDEKTAEIRLNKIPDRESTFLVNGTYYANIICITNDHPIKTATGTIAIQVEDFNDHCPILTNSAQRICYKDSVVFITATDADLYPNAEPFDFRVVTKSTKEKWKIEHVNGTTAILRSEEILWPGYYTVELAIRDQQGKQCSNQILNVAVCMCDVTKVCHPEGRTSTGVKFGAAGVLVMLLGLLLLLLIPLLLLFCLCGGPAAAGVFKTFPTDQTQHLMLYHTEGQGEDKEIPLLQIPTEVDAGVKGSQLGQGGGKGQWSGAWGGELGGAMYQGWGGELGGAMYQGWGGAWSGMKEEGISSTLEDGQHFKYFKNNMKYMGQSGLRALGTYEDIALSEAFLGDYYSKKSRFMAETHASCDSLLLYNLEGDGSSAEQFDDICCDLNEGDDLAFLNDIGLQFKKLAELCHGSTIDITVSTVKRPPAPKSVHSGTQLNVREESTMGMGASHARESSTTSASAFASGSASGSSTHITATDYHQSSSTSAAGLLTHNIPSQTLLIQQPAVYYTSAPLYMVDSKPQNTLLVAARPVLGMRENVVLVEQTGADLGQGASTLGLKQTHTKVLVEKSSQPAREAAVVEASGPQVLLGHSEFGSGSFRIMESERLQTTEPFLVGQSSLHSSISNGHSMQVSKELPGSQNGLTMMQRDLPLLTAPHGGTHQKVWEERIVEKSFQSSSTT